jgi:hypothetical protein
LCGDRCRWSLTWPGSGPFSSRSGGYSSPYLLGSAALDVFAEAPLPPESPLWTLPNVLIAPHSASSSDRENARLTDQFCESLERHLRNMLDTTRLYRAWRRTLPASGWLKRFQ